MRAATNPAASDDGARLVAAGVSYTYPGPVKALDGASLALEEGELLCLIGPNGSGKSTLTRCMAGLLAPDVGTIRLSGAPVGELSDRARARMIAVVPQFLPALPDVSVSDFVVGGRYAWFEGWRGPQRGDRDAAAAALREADAWDIRDRVMAELSGGQRQRVLIARALAQQARVVLVDEPTTGLDPEHQILCFELLARLAEAGRAVGVVTHDLNLASQFASRVALLHEGRVVADGGVEEVLCPATLTPVYGPRLRFGRLPGAGARPYVLPWREPGPGPSGAPGD